MVRRASRCVRTARPSAQTRWCGTQPDAADNERLSLRYLYAKAPGVTAGMDEVNATLGGPISLHATRQDLDEKGAAQVKFNAVKGA